MAEEYRFRKTNAEKINDVLFDIWDPIGINTHDGWPRDEYQSYVSEVQVLLDMGANEDVIFCCLQEIECRAMGLRDCYVPQTLAAAKALVNLYLPQGVAFDS